ncbi:MAG: SIR2 family protein [Bifidobacteriaceae bacterium]|nr:SIR2 family protein [Bifidobacteriaceae bacterium]
MLSALARDGISRLSLDSLDVTYFSQAVSDAFAGKEWFTFLDVLDSDRPNVMHRLAASLAIEGRLRAILTTNFDTLFEQALNDVRVPYHVATPIVDNPANSIPDDCLLVLKLHGNITAPNSLVDLATQKKRGLPDEWVALCASLFSSCPTLVAGFSGRDLDLKPDYLGLFAASKQIPYLFWVVHPGSFVPPVVERLMGEIGNNSILAEAGISSLAESLGFVADVGESPVYPHVDTSPAWRLPAPFTRIEACVAIARLCALAGDQSTSREIRTSLVDGVASRVGQGTEIDMMDLLHYELALAQCGADALAEGHLTTAHAYLTMGINLNGEYTGALERSGFRFISPALEEQRLNRAAMFANLASAAAGLRLPEARGYAYEAMGVVGATADGVAKTRRLASVFASLSAVEQADGNMKAAHYYLIGSRQCFELVGDARAAEGVRAVSVAIGEPLGAGRSLRNPGRPFVIENPGEFGLSESPRIAT